MEIRVRENLTAPTGNSGNSSGCADADRGESSGGSQMVNGSKDELDVAPDDRT